MSIMSFRRGWWSFHSKTNPAWDMSGTGVVGGFVMCDEAIAALEERKKKLGEPPKDLIYSCMKD